MAQPCHNLTMSHSSEFTAQSGSSNSSNSSWKKWGQWSNQPGWVVSRLSSVFWIHGKAGNKSNPKLWMMRWWGSESHESKTWSFSKVHGKASWKKNSKAFYHFLPQSSSSSKPPDSFGFSSVVSLGCAFLGPSVNLIWGMLWFRNPQVWSVFLDTHPQINSLHLKIDGGKTSVILGFGPFREGNSTFYINSIAMLAEGFPPPAFNLITWGKSPNIPKYQVCWWNKTWNARKHMVCPSVLAGYLLGTERKKIFT